MKIKQWKTSNKMLFESEHKTFNSKCNYIGTGNVYSNVQSSSFIRPSFLLGCNGFTNPIGYLQNYDLNSNVFDALSTNQKNKIKESTDLHNGSILYKFFHLNKGIKIIHGFILTDKDHNYIFTFMHNETNKSYSVLNECKKYITN
jgi:hypothetical protein